MNPVNTYPSEVRYNVLFEGVDENVLHDTIGQLTKIQVPAGEVIFEDGSEGDCLYLLVSGTVKISKKTRSGEEVIIGILHPGDFFGELDLIDRRSRSARATAVRETTVMSLDRERFNLLLGGSRAFMRNLLHMLSLRLRSSNFTYVQQEESNLLAVHDTVNKLSQLIEAAKVVNSSLDIHTLLTIILKTATKMVDADRGTVYLVDEASNELWSTALQGAEIVEIRMPIGKGIAGYVGATGKTINLSDAYADPRFNPEIDRASGYRTTTILCMPMRNKDARVVGVFQLLNKHGGVFSREDEQVLDALSVHAAIAIENAQLARRMIQNERLSAVGRMASTIVHDIKNPMGVLRLSAQVIRSKSKSKSVTKIADDMIIQIDRFVNMAREILDFSRGVTIMEKKTVDVQKLMRELVAFVERDFIKRKLTVRADLRTSGMISVDEEKLLRVFYNVTANAADAMSDGGVLTIDVHKQNDLLAIEFIDTGIGMPAEIKAKIFEPFMTHGKQYGTGLGMSIVKKIVDDHGGTIEVKSEPGQGTTVRILLPLPENTG